MPITQPSGDNVKRASFLIRTATDTAPVLGDVRRAFQRVDPSLPILSERTLEKQMARYTAQDRSIAQLAVAFGSVALTLAAIGLYGVLSYGIARRKSEIALRIALGARPGSVVAMILRETVGLVTAGLALGAAYLPAQRASRLDPMAALRQE